MCVSGLFKWERKWPDGTPTEMVLDGAADVSENRNLQDKEARLWKR